MSKWIPVSKKLPNGRELVLCCGTRGGMFVGWVCDELERDGKAYGFDQGGKGRRLTHWMPLPKLPEVYDE